MASSDIDPGEILDHFLSENHHIGLEAALLDAATGQVSASLADIVRLDIALMRTLPYKGGSDARTYAGAIQVHGVSYTVEFEVWTDIDGYRCVTNIAKFEPVEWQTVVTVAADRSSTR